MLKGDRNLRGGSVVWKIVQGYISVIHCRCNTLHDWPIRCWHQIGRWLFPRVPFDPASVTCQCPPCFSRLSFDPLPSFSFYQLHRFSSISLCDPGGIPPPPKGPFCVPLTNLFIPLKKSGRSWLLVPACIKDHKSKVFTQIYRELGQVSSFFTEIYDIYYMCMYGLHTCK